MGLRRAADGVSEAIASDYKQMCMRAWCMRGGAGVPSASGGLPPGAATSTPTRRRRRIREPNDNSPGAKMLLLEINASYVNISDRNHETKVKLECY